MATFQLYQLKPPLLETAENCITINEIVLTQNLLLIRGCAFAQIHFFSDTVSQEVF